MVWSGYYATVQIYADINLNCDRGRPNPLSLFSIYFGAGNKKGFGRLVAGAPIPSLGCRRKELH